MIFHFLFYRLPANMKPLLLLLALFMSCLMCGTTQAKDCSNGADNNQRFDCMPDNPSQQGCESRGCCWQAPSNKTTRVKGNIGVPNCFYPADFPYYEMDSPKVTDFGWTAAIHRNESFYYPGIIKQLQLDVYVETNTRLHFKVMSASLFTLIDYMLR